VNDVPLLIDNYQDYVKVAIAERLLLRIQYQVYATGRTNTLLQMRVIFLWILNAWLYSIVICLLFYYAIFPMRPHVSIFYTGTMVFVGVCNALQLKVAFMLHQWTWIQAFVFILSIFGMLAYFAAIGDAVYEYRDIPVALYNQGFFWCFGFFAVPIFVIYIDVFSYQLLSFFAPSKETLYREIELLVETKHYIGHSRDETRPSGGSVPVHGGDQDSHINQRTQT
jgi:Phospholipid-translocating P-type ATPase C-terminal